MIKILYQRDNIVIVVDCPVMFVSIREKFKEQLGVFVSRCIAENDYLSTTCQQLQLKI